MRVIEAFEKQLVTVGGGIHAVAASGAASVVWGANDVLRELIDCSGPMPRGTTIVDSDPEKVRIRGLPVVRPEKARATLRDAAQLVICTPHHAEAILAMATDIAGDHSLAKRTVVVGELEAK